MQSMLIVYPYPSLFIRLLVATIVVTNNFLNPKSNMFMSSESLLPQLFGSTLSVSK